MVQTHKTAQVKRPLIVVADIDFGNGEAEREMVEAAGIAFEFHQGDAARTPQALIRHLRDADGAITSYGQFTAEVFEALPQLKVVSKTGTGVDNIDVAAASANGTAVCNVPDYGTQAVSDHALALTLAVLRRINEIDADVRQGVWDHQRRRPLGQVRGRTFGVVGMGNIGRAVAEKARGLGFRVVAWDRRMAPGSVAPQGFPCLALEDLLGQSDVVSFHVALTPDTRHLLNARNIGLLKRDCVIINTSRGAVVDVDALAAALESGALWGAGLDVFPTEPLPVDAPIMGAPHTVLSSHCAYWSEESGAQLRERCVEAAIDVVQGRPPASCVNPDVLPAAFAKRRKGDGHEPCEQNEHSLQTGGRH